MYSSLKVGNILGKRHCDIVVWVVVTRPFTCGVLGNYSQGVSNTECIAKLAQILESSETWGVDHYESSHFEF